MEYVKNHTAYKEMVSRGAKLDKILLDSTSEIARLVGSTLGPGGRPVAIERQEWNLPPVLTKDGVTVFRSLGFRDSCKQAVLELMRDASVRTADEAGDGTTTATILSEILFRKTHEFCKNHPHTPPIRVIHSINRIWKEILEPSISDFSLECDFSTPQGKERLRQVALISANGDKELSEAVIKCYEIAGDDGNVTILESSGPFGYEVEKLEGFPVLTGFEESCGKFFPVFINDQANQRVMVDKPMFILFNGRISDWNALSRVLMKLQVGYMSGEIKTPNLVVYAAGYGDNVLANLASVWGDGSQLNIFPALIPNRDAILNAQTYFLEDLAAITGASIFDPGVTKSLDDLKEDDIGNLYWKDDDPETRVLVPQGVKFFECNRYRSNIVGYADPEQVLVRADEIKASIAAAESQYDRIYHQERYGKLSGGLAKLRVVGSSNGELKERRDRAEDAVCAVRGAIKHGCIIGGGWTLLALRQKLQESLKNGTPLDIEIYNEILNEVLVAPLLVLHSNAGYVTQVEKTESNPDGLEVSEDINEMYMSVTGKLDPKKAKTFDVAKGKLVSGLKEGILDSTPALKEALRNSISIATSLGTLGGIVVQPRVEAVDRQEARDAKDYDRAAREFDPNDRT